MLNLSGKKILVTGGSGFLGSHLLPKLVALGADVTCISRSKNNKFSADTRIIPGDCASGSGLDAAIAGQDIIIHMAALLFGHGWQDYLRANSAAARNIAEAINKCGHGPKTIYISSLAAAGPCSEAPGKKETDVPMPVSAYGWSKLLGEQILAGAQNGQYVVLRPPIIYGSGDRGLLPVFKGVKRGFAPSPGFGRKFPISAIHAEDAARSIILALDPKASGIYHLGDGTPYDMDIFCNSMARAMGRDKIKVLHVPLPIMAASAFASSAFGMGAVKLCGHLNVKPPKPGNWNLDKYRESRQAGWLSSCQRIIGELGFSPEYNLEKGMAETVSGYRRLGWL